MPAARRTLDLAHASGRELALIDGRIRVLGLSTAEEDRVLTVALGLQDRPLRALLEPYRCAWCTRSGAELPDACTTCIAAIRHYQLSGDLFAMGRAVAHAFRSWTTTACGLDLVAMEAPTVPLALVAPGELCRRCLGSLVREHGAHLADERRPRG
jgi:hypothetical protein